MGKVEGVKHWEVGGPRGARSFSLAPPSLRTVCAWAWGEGALAAARLPASLRLPAVTWGSEWGDEPFELDLGGGRLREHQRLTEALGHL